MECYYQFSNIFEVLWQNFILLFFQSILLSLNILLLIIKELVTCVAQTVWPWVLFVIS